MSVVDLRRRLTRDLAAYCQAVKSVESLIYAEPPLEPVRGEVATVDLSVGDQYYDTTLKQYFLMPEGGLVVHPNTSVVIETKQELRLPHNVLGLLTGKGRFIYRAGFLSPGKIDPGFQGRLRVGFYNAGGVDIVLRSGEAFCSCLFLTTESEEINPTSHRSIDPPVAAAKAPWYARAVAFCAGHWEKVIPIAISLGALVVSIIAFGVNKGAK
jgi:dUTPase